MLFKQNESVSANGVSTINNHSRKKSSNSPKRRSSIKSEFNKGYSPNSKKEHSVTTDSNQIKIRPSLYSAFSNRPQTKKFNKIDYFNKLKKKTSIQLNQEIQKLAGKTFISKVRKLSEVIDFDNEIVTIKPGFNKSIITLNTEKSRNLNKFQPNNNNQFLTKNYNRTTTLGKSKSLSDFNLKAFNYNTNNSLSKVNNISHAKIPLEIKMKYFKTFKLKNKSNSIFY